MIDQELFETLLGVALHADSLLRAQISLTWLDRHFTEPPIEADDATLRCYARAYIYVFLEVLYFD